MAWLLFLQKANRKLAALNIMGKILILIKDGEVRANSIEEEDVMGWAKYWFQRKIEKEGWEAEEAYLVDNSSKLPVSKWARQFHEEIWRNEAKEFEQRERAKYEELKKKYEK